MSKTTTESVLFLSYSRSDADLVHRLEAAIRERGVDTWVDRKNIPSASEWMVEIRRGIESSIGFVFVITPHSLTSRICRVELSIAAELSKRLLPLWPYEADEWESARARVIETLGAEADFEVPTELSKLDYIELADFLDCEEPFDAMVDELIEASTRDMDWLHRHTRLEQDVKRWTNARYATSALLRGSLLDEAEAMLDAPDKDPPLSALQREFIDASRAEQIRLLQSEATELAGHVLNLPHGKVALGIMLVLEGFELYLPVPKLKGALRSLLSRWSQRTLMTHAAPVSWAAFLHEGARVVTASEDGQLQLFESDTGKLLNSIGDDSAPLRGVGLAQQPERVIASFGDGSLRFFDFVTGDASIIELTSREIQGVAVSDDARLIVAASGTVPIVLDLDGDRKFDLPAHPEPIISVTVVGHELVVTSCEDGLVRLFDLVNQSSGEIGLPEDGKIDRILASPDATWIALAGSFIGVYLFDLTSRQLIGRIDTASSVLQLARDGQGNRIALANVWGRVYVFDLGARELLLERGLFPRYARSLALNADGSLLCAGSDDGNVAVVEIASGREQRYHGHDGAVVDVRFDDSARSMVSAGADGTARVFQVLGSTVSLTINHEATVIGAEVAADGSSLVTAARDGAMRVFDTATGTLRFERPGSEDELVSATFVSSSELIAAYTDGSIVMLDAADGRETRRIETAPIESHSEVRVTSGQRVVVRHFDEIRGVYSLGDGGPIEDLSPSDWESIAAELDLRTGRLAGNVRLCMPEDESPIPHLSVDGARIDLELPDAIVGTCLSPDGLVAAAASVNRPEVYIFDTATGDLVSTLWVGHSVNGSTFGPDGRRIVATWLNAVSIVDFPPFEELLEQARSQLHRGLTNQERVQFGLPVSSDVQDGQGP